MARKKRPQKLPVDRIDTEIAAGIVGISEEMIRVYCRRGKFPGARQRRGRWTIPRKAVEGFEPASVGNPTFGL